MSERPLPTHERQGHLSARSETAIPYPPVFHDWEFANRRVATTTGIGGVCVEITMGVEAPALWYRVELTETDACLLAASLLLKAGQKKLSRRVLRRLEKAVGEGT